MAPIPKESYSLYVQKEPVFGEFWRDVSVELIATFLYVSGQIGLTLLWTTDGSAQIALQAGLGAAFLWTALRYGFYGYGGAHLNPAVTLAMVVRAEITAIRGLLYLSFQLVGGILGGLFIHGITPPDHIGSLGMTFLGEGVKDWQGVLIEMWTTFILCLVTLTTEPDNLLPSGLAVGFGTLVSFASTGGSMNPARSLGAAVAFTALEDIDLSWENHWVYWVGPLAGGLLAGSFIWLLGLAKPTDLSERETDDSSHQEKHRNGGRLPRVTNPVYSADRPQYAWQSSGDRSTSYRDRDYRHM